MFAYLKKLFRGKGSQQKQKTLASPAIQSKAPENPSSSVAPAQKDTKDTAVKRVIALIEKQLSLDELRDLSFLLEVDFELLEGDTKRAKVSSLVALFSKPPRTLDQFVESCSQLFPDIDWSDQPSPAEPDIRSLLQRINYCFNANEFRTLCLELGIDSENLPGSGLGKVRELLVFLSRKRRLDELVAICSRLRPNIDWYVEGKFSEPYQLKNLAALQQLLYDNIDEETIRQFCQKLDVDYKRLPMWEHGGTARELVLYLARRKRLEELVSLCYEQLPDLPWNDVLFNQNILPDARAQDKKLVDPIKLKQELSQLSENSLRTLCLLLSLNYDDLPGKNQSDELFSLIQRHQRMLDLADALENLPDDV